ncbi:MAG: hypothetical protein SF029_24085 [bacterium]|nr:hypothetical protein [bacterium]
MTLPSLEEKIAYEIQRLDEKNQRRVLAYVQSLSARPKGVSGSVFLERTRDIYIATEDLEAIQALIEAEFEQITEDE